MVPKMTSKFSVNFMEKYTLLLVLLDCIFHKQMNGVEIRESTEIGGWYL